MHSASAARGGDSVVTPIALPEFSIGRHTIF
jgi:hypothetical protein